MNEQPQKILFMGTPEFGAVVLQALATSPYQVVGVVTQPDRPAGRKNQLTPPAVKLVAQEFKLPVLQVERLRDRAVIEQLREFSQAADVFVVASFGMILPPAVLTMPRLQCLNVHGSLLPQYRGASPVAQAILDGQTETGVTIMLMERGLDTGPMLSKRVVPISAEDTQTTLMLKLAKVGADLLLETLPLWTNGKLEPQPQDVTQASITGIIKKEDGRVDWTKEAACIERMTRAYEPWPGVFTNWNGQLLKILRAKVLDENAIALFRPEPPLESGKVYAAQLQGENKNENLVIATGKGLLAPTELQLAGKKAASSRDFLRGYPAIIGAKLGS